MTHLHRMLLAEIKRYPYWAVNPEDEQELRMKLFEIMLTSGFDEGDPLAHLLVERALLEAAQKQIRRIVGVTKVKVA